MKREEFVQLVLQTQEALRRFLLALCLGDRNLADDIAQETYLKAWIGRGEFRGDSRFSTWLRRIAYNSYINTCRSNRNYVSLESTELSQKKTDSEADDNFKYQDLYCALQLLTPAERTTILLYYMEGYTVNDIAIIQKSNTNAVKQQLSRGRKHLRSILDRQIG